MSRIGNRNLIIPEGVMITIDKNLVTVKGPKGELSLKSSELINIEIENNILRTTVKKLTRESNIMQGTTNSLINNMIIGVSEGFNKGLEAVGVGYKFNVQGNKIVVNAGYSHPIEVIVPDGLKAELINNTEINISGTDKQKVTEFAANIRKIREPEPYKGKGIRYKGEYVRRKEGKKAA